VEAKGSPGGQPHFLYSDKRIVDIPGFPDGISGEELSERTYRQAVQALVQFRFNEELVAIDETDDVQAEDRLKRVITGQGSYLCRKVIVACGLLAYVIARTNYFARWAFDLVTWLPFMIPGIVLSLGYMFFSLDTPLMQFFYGTKFLLVVILALTVMTFSVQMMKSTLLQLGFDLEEAGRVNGGSRWFTARHILIPLMLPTAAVVAVMVFGSVSRQVGSIVLLTTAESEPLSVLQLGYLRSEDYSAASVVGTILAGFGIVLAMMVRKSGYKFGAHQV
jgi:ABC-type spermidine/putrescine transport system permease subunit II